MKLGQEVEEGAVDCVVVMSEVATAVYAVLGEIADVAAGFVDEMVEAAAVSEAGIVGIEVAEMDGAVRHLLEGYRSED